MTSVPRDDDERDLDETSNATHNLWPSEVLVSEVVGRLIEFWGFKRNMGRVWSVLYLSESPLTAQELRDRLCLSAGAISMTLAELTRWGVVKKVWVQGDRRDHFAAEVQLWRMISRVLAERERAEITNAIESFEAALRSLRDQSSTAQDRQRAAFQAKRIQSLLDIAKLGKTLLEGLLSNAKVDAEPLASYSINKPES